MNFLDRLKRRARPTVSATLLAALALTTQGVAASAPAETYDAGGFELPGFATNAEVAMLAWIDIEALDTAVFSQTAVAIAQTLPTQTKFESSSLIMEAVQMGQAWQAWHTSFVNAGGRGLLVGVNAFDLTSLQAGGPMPVFMLMHTAPDTTLDQLRAIGGFGEWPELLANARPIEPGWFALGLPEFSRPRTRDASPAHASMFAKVLGQHPDATVRLAIRPQVLLRRLGPQIEPFLMNDPQTARGYRLARQVKGMSFNAWLGSEPSLQGTWYFAQADNARAFVQNYINTTPQNFLTAARANGYPLTPAQAQAIIDTIEVRREDASVHLTAGLDYIRAIADVFAPPASTSTSSATRDGEIRNAFSR